MKLNVLVIADVHWGAIDSNEQLKSMEFIFQTIDELESENIQIHMVVIAGDYFDSKLPLNSREAIVAIQWFHRFFETCKNKNIQKIRMIQGTYDHDNDQLDAFDSFEDETDFFKIIRKTTSEEIAFDDVTVKCIFCPDENIQTKEYEEIYTNEILTDNDLGFFHGSFDVVYGELLAKNPDLMNKKNVIFNYRLYNQCIKGPLISGHWHDGKSYGDLHYVGTPFRYKFNELESKGIGFVQYDTATSEYFYKKIINPLCASYITYEIYSNLCNSKEDYQKEINEIRSLIDQLDETSYLNNKLRIMVYLCDEKPENEVFMSSLRQTFINHKNIKIVIKNKLKDKIKKEVVKKNKERQLKYDFIFNKEKSESEIIHDFIHENMDGAEVPIEFITEKVKKYMK